MMLHTEGPLGISNVPKLAAVGGRLFSSGSAGSWVASDRVVPPGRPAWLAPQPPNQGAVELIELELLLSQAEDAVRM